MRFLSITILSIPVFCRCTFLLLQVLRRLIFHFNFILFIRFLLEYLVCH